MSFSSNFTLLFFQSSKNCFKLTFKFFLLNEKNFFADKSLSFLFNFSFKVSIGYLIFFFCNVFSKCLNPFLIFIKFRYFGISAFNLLNPSLILFLSILDFILIILLINCSFLKSSNFFSFAPKRHLFK